MENKRKMFWLAAISGMVGAGVGSVSGNNGLFVTLCVGVIISLLVVWGLDGMLK